MGSYRLRLTQMLRRLLAATATWRIGVARMMGFRAHARELQRCPFTSPRAPADFWRRWHITLYSFMRDYLYFALGGSRGGSARVIFNAMVTMTVVGFWHGADWQFVVWGVYNGLLIVGQRLVGQQLVRAPGFRSWLGTVPGTVLRVAVTDILFFLSFCIFRSPSATDAVQSVGRMLVFDGAGQTLFNPWILAGFGAVLLGNLAAEFKLPTRIAGRMSLPVQCVAYAALIVVLVLFSPHDTQAFVYFQF